MDITDMTGSPPGSGRDPAARAGHESGDPSCHQPQGAGEVLGHLSKGRDTTPVRVSGYTGLQCSEVGLNVFRVDSSLLDALG